MEGALASSDTRVFDLWYPEHSSFAQVWILPEEKSIGHDGADQRSYDKGYKAFSRF